MNGHNNNNTQQHIRVAIIGAGAAGLSAAYSLSRYPNRYTVDIYDPLRKVGGVATFIFCWYRRWKRNKNNEDNCCSACCCCTSKLYTNDKPSQQAGWIQPIQYVDTQPVINYGQPAPVILNYNYQVPQEITYVQPIVHNELSNQQHTYYDDTSTYNDIAPPAYDDATNTTASAPSIDATEASQPPMYYDANKF